MSEKFDQELNQDYDGYRTPARRVGDKWIIDMSMSDSPIAVPVDIQFQTLNESTPLPTKNNSTNRKRVVLLDKHEMSGGGNRTVHIEREDAVRVDSIILEVLNTTDKTVKIYPLTGASGSSSSMNDYEGNIVAAEVLSDVGGTRGVVVSGSDLPALDNIILLSDDRIGFRVSISSEPTEGDVTIVAHLKTAGSF